MTSWNIALALVLSLFSISALAEPTNITVRVLGKDSKFIGTSMGGMRITIRDADTGTLLAEGLTSGDTGDTKHLMQQDRKRGTPLWTKGAGEYTATIDLQEPRLLEVTAYGPLAQRQSSAKVSSSQWVIPGKHITEGDAWLLELPGFVVDVLAPAAHVKLKGAPQSVNIQAYVAMMCGCPVTPNGIWNADKYEVKALLKRNGEKVGEMPFKYAGAPSMFSATWAVDQLGTYEAMVYAYDPATGNTGLDSVTFVVE